MLLVTLTSIGLALGGQKAVSAVIHDSGYWDSKRVLSGLSGLLLSVFAIYLFVEWKNDSDDTESDDEARQDDHDAQVEMTPNIMSQEVDAERPRGQSAEENNGPGFEPGHRDHRDHRKEATPPPTTRSLVTVALLGSVDHHQSPSARS